MNDTLVTVVGNVVDSPRRVSLRNGAVTNFRMASTARRYDAAGQRFVDASTFWIDVECWNDLSSNVSATISKGDPVIVHGMLSTHSWDTDSGRRNRPQIRATAVGPNLARGTAQFRRSQPLRPVGQPVEEPADTPVGTPSGAGSGSGLDVGTGLPRHDLVDPEREFDEGAGGEPAGGNEGLLADVAHLVRGRDYEEDAAALHPLTTGDLPPEPVSA